MNNTEKRKLFTPVKDRPRCLYCHKPLQEWTDQDKEAAEKFYRRDPDAENRQLGIPTGEFGYLANGFFCTLRCGYQWAVKQARAITRNK